MIALFIIALIVCAVIGYKVADAVEDVMLQRTMNKWRRELDLAPKPVTIRFKKPIGV